MAAYTFGKRKDEASLELKAMLEPLSVRRYYTDDWDSCQRNLPDSEHSIGKENTQSIGRQNRTFRTRITRLARKTICFSKTTLTHDTVIGLFIN
ncbi:MAG: IS1 family transposase [Treponema sp.]|nr:IS1 family transposase [Treponema sp.]